MAKNNNLTDFLVDLAAPIKTLHGTEDSVMNPQEFSTNIATANGTIDTQATQISNIIALLNTKILGEGIPTLDYLVLNIDYPYKPTDGVKLSWNKLTNAATYNLKSTSADGQHIIATGIDATTYTLTRTDINAISHAAGNNLSNLTLTIEGVKSDGTIITTGYGTLGVKMVAYTPTVTATRQGATLQYSVTITPGVSNYLYYYQVIRDNVITSSGTSKTTTTFSALAGTTIEAWHFTPNWIQGAMGAALCDPSITG